MDKNFEKLQGAPKSHALELVNVAFRCHVISAVKFNLVIKSNILCITGNFVRIRVSETEYYENCAQCAKSRVCLIAFASKQIRKLSLLKIVVTS